MAIISRVGMLNGFGREETTRRRATPRAVLALLALVSLLLAGTASSAHAGPRGDLIDCGDTDAPIPASPYGDGSFIARPSNAETELPAGYKPGEIVDASDPFRSPDTVSLESTYGTAYRWWVYDVGCTGKFVAGAGTSLANIELQVAGIMPSWSHALLDTIIGDSDLFAALDAPVAAATKAVADGVWGPWLPISLLAMAALVLWRARSGHLGGAVTAATTAVVVLGLSSFLMQYPTESVRWVDAGVRNVTGVIASGFSEGKVLPKGGASATQATGAIDAQMDDLIRDTQYRTWLDGVFGDPDSAIARQYGPRVFRATHFSFAEYTAYRSDPNGEGQKILEAKQAAFKEHAEAIKRADPVAYEAFTGKDWTSRATSALVNLLVVAVPCLFFLLAGLFALMGFMLIRLVVPLAPAAGVIFMYDKTRDLAIGWLKRVAGPLIMGPVCFVVALVLLRFTSAIFEAENMWFVLKLGLITVLTVIAFRLSGVLGMVPGYEQARRRITAALSTAVGTAVGAAAGSRVGMRPDEMALATSVLSRTEVPMSPGGVWHPTFEARAPSPPQVLEPPADFVPYKPPPKALGTSEAVAAEPGVPAEQRTVVPPPGSLSLKRIRERWPAPHSHRRVHVEPLGPRTNFPPPGFVVEANTAYEVEDRGTYYSDDNAKLRYVDTDYGKDGVLNWDLNWPLPNATFVVSGIHVFVTDHASRTIEANDPHMALRDAPRSKSVQSAVGDLGGPGYDGGHWLQNAAGGGPERINVGAMLATLNRAVSQDSPEKLTDNYYDLETFLRSRVRELTEDGATKHDVGLKVIPVYDRDSRVPSRFRAQFIIDGELEEEEFENVRPDKDEI
ncbi:MAG: hypothetical protein ACRDS9_05340 [Pseudonocardiaceae bacterium]